MSKLKPFVIVLSRNYSTGLGIIRSLGAAGYRVDLIASTKKKGSSVIISSSKYLNKTTEVLSPKIQGDTGASLMEVLMEYAKCCGEKMVLFPADDFTASVVDSNRGVLDKHFLIPHTTRDSDCSIVDLMDKTMQESLAKKAGLLTPLAWRVSLKETVIIPEDVVYPCFVKPIESVSGRKTEMMVCWDRTQLKGQLMKMKKFFSNRSVLIQEYLHIDKEYDMSGICLDQKVIIPGIIEKIRVAEYERGVTMSGRMLPPDILGETLERVKMLMKQCHYVGMFDVELNLCGDKIYFNEVNFRSGGPNFAYYLNGVNLPEIFVKEITGEERSSEDETITSFGKTFVYEKVVWEDYIYGYMTKRELHRCIKNADYTLLSNTDDPAPGKIFQKRIRLSALKHRVKHLLQRETEKKDIADTRKADDRHPVAVVVGRNYGNILTMTRDLGMEGYQIDVLRVYKKKPKVMNLLSRMKPEIYSKYVRQFHQCVSGDNPARLLHSLSDLAASNGRTLLIPVDDYTAQIIDENLEELKPYYILPNISGCAGALSQLMNKAVQKKLAATFSLPVLDSVLVKSRNGQFELPETIVYPCFIKPNVSSKDTKAKMMKCRDRDELNGVLREYAASSDFEILVETFAEIKAEYSLLGVSTAAGVIAPGLFRVVAGGHRERKGVALMGETVSHSLLQPIVEQCIAFVDSLNYTGLFDIDLIETTDGNIYFVELNFRAGASIHAFTRCGVNLPAMYADYLLKGKELNLNCSLDIAGKRFVSEKILLEEYVRSDLSLSEGRMMMDSADICFIKADDDPKPYQYFKRFYFVAALMRIPYRIRDRRAVK